MRIRQLFLISALAAALPGAGHAAQPLTLAQLKDLFPEEEPAPPGSIERALERLREA